MFVTGFGPIRYLYLKNLKLMNNVLGQYNCVLLQIQYMYVFLTIARTSKSINHFVKDNF
jgi:hypothetical protein